MRWRPAVARHHIASGDLLGIGGVNDDTGQAVTVERDGDGEADQPPAQDDHVRLFHFPDLVMQRRIAKSRCAA
jgi:hypothetical protein